MSRSETLDRLESDIDKLRQNEDDTVLTVFGVEGILSVTYTGEHEQLVKDLVGAMDNDIHLRNLVHDIVIKYESFNNDLNRLI